MSWLYYWPVWLNGWLFVYELSGYGFESRCCHTFINTYHIMVFTIKEFLRAATETYPDWDWKLRPLNSIQMLMSWTCTDSYLSAATSIANLFQCFFISFIAFAGDHIDHNWNLMQKIYLKQKALYKYICI